MNAKKIILLAASTMLLASCGQSLNRADAIKEMDTISKKTGLTATKLTYVKEWKETGTGEKDNKIKGKVTKVYDAENDAVHVTRDYKDGETTVKGDVWLITDKGEYTIALDDGTNKKYAKSTSDAVEAYVKGKAKLSIDAAITAGLNHGNKDNKYGYCGFLNRFPEGEGKMEAGSSVAEGAYIKDEKYVKNGEGSMSCSYNAVYPNQGDEVMKAEWKDYFLVAKSNAKLSSSGYGFETWKYGEGKVSAPKLDGYTAVEGTVAIAAFLLEIGVYMA